MVGWVRLICWLQEPVCTACKLMMVVWQPSHILPAMWSAWVQMNVSVCGNGSRDICLTRYKWLVLTQSLRLCSYFVFAFYFLMNCCCSFQLFVQLELRLHVQCKIQGCTKWHSQSLHLKNLHFRKMCCHEPNIPIKAEILMSVSIYGCYHNILKIYDFLIQ